MDTRFTTAENDIARILKEFDIIRGEAQESTATTIAALDDSV
jgi:hypothetical protein